MQFSAYFCLYANNNHDLCNAMNRPSSLCSPALSLSFQQIRPLDNLLTSPPILPLTADNSLTRTKVAVWSREALEPSFECAALFSHGVAPLE